jgi:hypothetical protein
MHCIPPDIMIITITLCMLLLSLSVQELVDNDEAHFADAGGFVSPSGISYIGVSKQKLGQVGRLLWLSHTIAASQRGMQYVRITSKLTIARLVWHASQLPGSCMRCEAHQPGHACRPQLRQGRC